MVNMQFDADEVARIPHRAYLYSGIFGMSLITMFASVLAANTIISNLVL